MSFNNLNSHRNVNFFINPQSIFHPCYVNSITKNGKKGNYTKPF